MFESIRKIFPHGNPTLIRRFIAERGAAYVREVAELMRTDAVDPAFVRRFTRSSDPRWAAFHTACTTGRPPPRRKAPAALQVALRAPAEPWAGLDAAGRLRELVALWRQAASLYLAAPPDAAEEGALSERLARELERGAGREALEALVFSAIESQRGRPIGKNQIEINGL